MAFAKWNQSPFVPKSRTFRHMMKMNATFAPAMSLTHNALQGGKLGSPLGAGVCGHAGVSSSCAGLSDLPPSMVIWSARISKEMRSAPSLSVHLREVIFPSK